MAIVGLDREQTFALLAEITSARNLLGYGVRVTRTGAFIETTRDPILTMLSIGVEKLYKLTLGVISLEEHGRWPTAAETKSWGHRLIPMHEAVLKELRARTVNKSEYVRGLVAEVENDPVVEPVIAALDMYGRMGRFYYLDQLGESPQPLSPEAAWEKIEAAALTDPMVEMLHQRTLDHLGNKDVWSQFIGALNDRIATAVERVWVMIAVSGRNHAFGETGSTFGFEVHPEAVGRQ